MARTYCYVGPPEILARVSGAPAGWTIGGPERLRAWLRETGQRPDASGLVRATYTIDTDGFLTLADRHDEHVACASGREVLSAGEIAFEVEGARVRVVEVTNQSTGYCPEPESWPAVASALDRIPLERPASFTTELVFRRCEACRERNVIKEGVFECALCGAELPAAWNFRREATDARE